MLREKGIALIPDLWNEAGWTDETDPTGAIRYWEQATARDAALGRNGRE